MPFSRQLVLLIATAFCFVALWQGLTLPIIALEKFWVFENEISVLSAVTGLASDGEWLLAIVVMLFSVLLPNLKLLHIGLTVLAPQLRISYLHAVLAALARWSMLDVFLVAVLVSAVKLGALAQAQTKIGLYWLVLATLSTIALTYLSDRLSGKANHSS